MYRPSVFRRFPAVLTLAVCLLPVAAQAYHASCANGRLPFNKQCVSSSNFRSQAEPGTAVFYICPATNGAANKVQYDYNVIWGGQTQYVCTHRHNCSGIKSVDPKSYNRFCK
ncbi:MAG: hypothetical protein AAF698_01470 [Pseudomonadota bacterium]